MKGDFYFNFLGIFRVFKLIKAFIDLWIDMFKYQKAMNIIAFKLLLKRTTIFNVIYW